MSKTRYKHNDCHNYAAVDVVKGICHKSKEQVMADEDQCNDFEKLPKCRHCTHYATGNAEHLGTCHAMPQPAMAYPDMVAITCDWFAWSKK